MKWNASWIASPEAPHDAADLFYRSFEIRKTVKKAEVYTTAKGVYEAFLNGSRIGDYILAPGWTVYQKRIQYQVYDVTALLRDGENRIEAVVGRGWYSSPLGWANDENKKKIVRAREKALLLELHLLYEDGEEEIIKTDESWLTEESAVRFSEIYDGETYDASFRPAEPVHCAVLPFGEEDLIPQEGELIREHEVIPAEKVFVTPEGEIMVDFGQEVTGYVEFTVNAKEGDVVRILHSEVMDREGNFYNENYRSAKAEINYICKGGLQTYHPHLTFFGFRYIKLDKWPEKAEDVRPGSFKAIAVYSDMKRTGYLKTSDSLLNRLILNAVWSQKDNFLDVPTDCPQRDERLGWTGDAAIFSKTASYTFDTRKFYKKWIHDIAADQDESGMIPHVIPNVLTNVDLESAGAPDDGGFKPTSACGWADCITMIPWNVYRTYGDVSILEDAFPVMQKYIDYIPTISKEEYLWTGTFQYGDWLGLDAEPGSYKGKSNDDFVASAFYAYTVSLFIKAGKVLKKDMSAYEALYRKIVETFRKRFPVYETQTEHVLALQFGLTEDKEKTAAELAALIKKDGGMKTGFLGTPFLLHVLSDNGYTGLAYDLLLKKDYPSWLYPVTKGATTIWEHWDGIMPDGSFWSPDMNSFNHYAYGSVCDWIYEKACGIQLCEDAPGFEKVTIAPQPDDRLDNMEASIETLRGTVSSRWEKEDGRIRYTIEVPVEAEAVIDGNTCTLEPGSHVLYGKA